MRLTPGDRDKIAALRAEQWSTPAIAAVIGVHPVTVLRALAGTERPERVLGSDGRPHPARMPKPKSCAWCQRAHHGPREYCSAQCRRERRRYRAYTGRCPQT